MAGTGKGIVEGLNMVVYARLLKDAESQDGKRLVLQTDGELTEKSKTDSEPTKDGDVINSKGLDSELSCTTFVDRASDQYKWLTESFRNKEKFELWLVDTGSTVSSDKKQAQYFRGIISEKKDKFGAESKLEVEITFTIEGKGKFGECKLPDSDGAGSVDYAFTTIKHGGDLLEV